jgi:thiol:disulfide interchange protein DsbD
MISLRALLQGAMSAMFGMLVLSLSLMLPSWPAQAEDYLAPEVAFKFSAHMVDAGTVQVDYAIADGYYMYRDRFHFRAEGATLGTPAFPAGKVKYDENFGKQVETYHNAVQIRLPVNAAGEFKLLVTGQGCADKGLCYPPMEHVATLSPAAIGVVVGPGDQRASAAPADDVSELEQVAATLSSGKLWVVMAGMFILGLGLSLLPCTWPMFPILSSIIIGAGGQQSRGRGLLLSIVYSQGMAIVYSVFGVAAALAGQSLTASLQNPWVLGAFAVLLTGLALSMFDLYQLQLPSAWQSKLSGASGRQSGGRLLGVLLMGALSALIIGPCVTAPLAGVLLFISQTHDVLLGGAALYAMALGMSVPLLLIGASAGALLPRAGGWMDAIKRFFGVLMLATAWWMVAPVIPAWLYVAGWAALGIAYGAYLLWGGSGYWVARAFGLVFAALGLLQLINVASGGRDALMPLSQLHGSPAASKQSDFVRVRSVAELDAALAQTGGKPALLDFYADWCVSCKEMEKFTFTDRRVQDKFAQMVLLQIDVTANNADDKAMLKRFQLFGPPGIILFDRQGRELAGKRVIGYQDAGQFLKSLQAVLP